MEPAEYKVVCKRPDALHRGLLEATEQALHLRHPLSAVRLREVLESKPIPKPELHTGGEDTDYFTVKMKIAEAKQIVEYLLDAEANAVGRDGETTSEANRLADLVDAWANYVDFCDRAST
jgi:hypothetical protein